MMLIPAWPCIQVSSSTNQVEEKPNMCEQKHTCVYSTCGHVWSSDERQVHSHQEAKPFRSACEGALGAVLGGTEMKSLG